MKKIKDSFAGILFGVIFIIVGSIMLIVNEHSNVKSIKDVKELRSKVVEVKSDKIDSKNEGKLINTSGSVTIKGDIPYDSLTNLKVSTPKLIRVVEMYQWVEEKETNNDKTTYSYKKKWSKESIDSNEFNNSTDHTNPSYFPYDNMEMLASNVYVGAYLLTDEQLDQLTTKTTYHDLSSIIIPSGYHVDNTYITNATDLNSPNVGDVRIYYVYNNSKDLTLLGQQKDNTVVGYVTKQGRTYNKVYDGKKTADETITTIETGHKITKWAFRGIGIFLNILGFMMLFAPISTLASFVPILGSLVGTSTKLISFALGTALSLLIIGIAWVVFRPVIGLSLLAVVILLVGLVIFLISKKKSN